MSGKKTTQMLCAGTGQFVPESEGTALPDLQPDWPASWDRAASPGTGENSPGERRWDGVQTSAGRPPGGGGDGVRFAVGSGGVHRPQCVEQVHAPRCTLEEKQPTPLNHILFPNYVLHRKEYVRLNMLFRNQFTNFFLKNYLSKNPKT